VVFSVIAKYLLSAAEYPQLWTMLARSTLTFEIAKV
jgi:hypothetical protein